MNWPLNDDAEGNANECVAWIKKYVFFFLVCIKMCISLRSFPFVFAHKCMRVYKFVFVFILSGIFKWQANKNEKLTKSDQKEYKPNTFAFYFSPFEIRHKAKHQKRISINKAQSLREWREIRHGFRKFEWVRELQDNRDRDREWNGAGVRLKCSIARMHCAYHALRMLSQNRFKFNTTHLKKKQTKAANTYTCRHAHISIAH